MVQQWNPLIDLVHRGPWWRNRGMIMLNLILTLPLLTSAINGFDSSLLNGLQVMNGFNTFFRLNQSASNPNASLVNGVMVSVQNVGALLALPIAPFISDGLGRRRSLCVGSFFMVVGVALQATTQGTAQFIVARGTIGFGLNIALNAAPLLITELAYPTQRGQITATYNSLWYLGSFVGAWVCFGSNKWHENTSWAWRIPSIVQAAPSLLQMILVWFIPESPRWLIAHGRLDEARQVLAKYHSVSGDIRDPLVAFEVAQIQHALRMEKEISKKTTFLTLFSTPGNRRRMRIVIALAIFSQWSGNGLISYYLARILKTAGLTAAAPQGEVNGSLQAFNVVVAVTASLLVERIGRRILFLSSNTGMLIIFACLTVTTALHEHFKDKASGTGTVFLIFCFYLFYDIAYTPLLISYAVEILPFNIRAKGFALMNIVVCLFLALNQFTTPVSFDNISWYYYIFYVGWLVVELAFVFRYVIETKGRTLEETAALFDGEQPSLELQQLGNEAATLTLNELQASTLRARLDARLAGNRSEVKLDSEELGRTESTVSSTA